ncbi:hypothetical protein OJF2_10400 [Aquisphaera giovannonii]|uniref:Glycosyltransferase RgtA/B/C/D-like domain-containing protein n=1 Tax=Aquisphaera giovannonii TaxID=406548 RepID=A0A5B9VW28_9BACT|nr:hypothetical protein [Aquisphaera giovannonii]QEH32563.1 hypothetical protein OJF2_10400 [Aquisphaera giovannonii]
MAEPAERSAPSDDRPACATATPGRLVLALAATALLLGPVVVAIWAVPYFVTQDGPAHLYNAWILARSFSPGSPFEPYFAVRWQPVPNWSGHLLLATLMKVASPWVADRAVLTLTLLGFAMALVALRWVVRGDRGLLGAGLVAAVLAPNMPWLAGFTSFLLGSIFFAVTLAAWWPGRDRPGAGRIALVGVLLALGYFCHLVSLGLTVLALGYLALFAPPEVDGPRPWRRRARRLATTALCGLPLLALVPAYLHLSRQGGPMQPAWENMGDPFALSGWLIRIKWADPLSLAVRDMIPFGEAQRPMYLAFAPVIWLLAAAIAWVSGGLPSAIRGRPAGGQPAVVAPGAGGVWTSLAAVLMLASLLSPDSMGEGHGAYLPQRVMLLGLAALVPGLDFRMGRSFGLAAAACVLAALALQSAIVWDYALHSQRTAGRVAAARDLVGDGRRIATLLADIRSRFRCNPLLHADGWLGVGNGNIVWSNYEAQFYYFPVQFRPGLDHPAPREFELVALGTDPEATPEAAARWESILAGHNAVIDEVVVWGRDPALDAITGRWFEPVRERGNVRVFAKKGAGAGGR